jgi:hypothetical protein
MRGNLTLQSNVGTAESRAWGAQLALNQAGEGADIRSVDLDALDSADSSSTRKNDTWSSEFVENGVQELMGNDKDQEGGILDDLLEMSDGGQVLGQRDLRQVPRVEMCTVDSLCQFLPVHL